MGQSVEIQVGAVPDVHPGQTGPHLLLSLQHPVELVLHHQQQGMSAPSNNSKMCQHAVQLVLHQQQQGATAS